MKHYYRIFILVLIFCASAPVLRGQALSVAIVSQMDIWCFGQCNGTATVSATGGTAPYTYLWMPGNLSSPTLSNACAGSYTCTVTDAATSTATVVVTLTQPSQLTLGTLSPVPTSYCEGQQVALTSTTTVGGTPPYTYSASPYPSWGFNVEAHNATYTLIITDGNGCTATNTITLTPGPNTLGLNPTIVNAACNQNTSSISLNVTGGSGVYTYSWWPGNMTTSSISNLAPGIYQVSVLDNTGCPINGSFNIADSCEYVYPGDANQDGVANNLDILDIGIANGANGYLRNSPTINWTPQYCWPWGQTLISGTDYKYVDCDGNGTIQPVDTNAVILNFGFTHNVRLGAPVYDASVPDLSVTLDQDTLGSGWRGSMNIALGDASNPASGVYGVAFTLSFDASMIDAATFSMNENGSWMGIPGSNLMGVVLHEGTGTGSVQVAITRLNQADTSGYGDIATVGFNATNTITGTGNAQNVNFTISNVTILSANESTQSVNAVGDSLVVADPGILTAVQTPTTATASVFPNPAQDVVNIRLSDGYAGDNAIITLRDITGRVITTTNSNGSALVTLNTENCSPGMYFITIESADRKTITQQLVISAQ